MTPFDPLDQRQRRETFAVELRKQKRSEGNQKRRLLAGQRYTQDSAEARSLEIRDFSVALMTTFPDLKSTVPGVGVETLKAVLSFPSLPHELYRDGLHALRKVMSRDIEPPTEEVIKAGFLPLVMRFINMHDYAPEIVLEATWIMCNLTSGSSRATQETVRAGAIQAFISVLDPNHSDINEVAVWGLGNISGDSPLLRDLLISSRAYEAIVTLIKQSRDLDLKLAQITAWTLSNIVRGKPVPPLNVCEEVIKAVEVLIKVNDSSVIKDSLWTLAHIADSDNEYTQLIINAGLGKVAIGFLTNTVIHIVNPALRITGNIVSGDDLMTQHALDQGLLEKLEPLLRNTEVQIRKEVMWTLSNVTAGTPDQSQAFLSHPIAREAVKAIADPEYVVRREASWCFSNITRIGKTSQKLQLLDLDILQPLKLLLNDTLENIPNALLIAENLLVAGQEHSRIQNLPSNIVAFRMEESGCVHALELLSHHPNPSIASSSARILNNYFTIEDNSCDVYQDAPEPRFSLG